jgi:glycosyltransferase involved in cell wall biosynthesis
MCSLPAPTDKPLKIGYFTDCYRPQTNGVVTSIDSFKAELERRGHQVWVFGPALRHSEPDPPRTLRFYGITYPGQPEYKWVLPWGQGCKVSDIPRLGLDLVHLHTEFGLGWMGLNLDAKHHIPAIRTNHTYWDTYLHYLPGPSWAYRRITRGITRRINDRLPMVLAPTHPIRDALLSYGIKSRIEILPTGVDLQRLKPARSKAAVRKALDLKPGTRLFASAGRLGQEKSWGLLLEALARVKQRRAGLDFKLLLLGDGPERQALRRQAQRLGLGQQLLLPGYVPRQQVIDSFAAADLFLFASQTETQGLVVLEALAQGTPCICVDVMGPGEILRDGKGGLLAEPDAEDLARCILQEETQPALRARLRREARAKACQYGLDRLTERLLMLYRQVIAAHPH